MNSALLYLASVPMAALAAAVGIPGWFLKSRPLDRVGRALSVSALGTVTAGWILRWGEAGHLPLFGTYESALSLAVATLLVAFLWDMRHPVGLRVFPWACAAASGLLAHGLSYDPTPYALTISERSWVVDLHAAFAWSAFGALAVNAGLALRRAFARGASPGLDRALGVSLSLGFLLHSGMMASGSFYKFLLFGRAWSFDPIETLGFAAWVAYGTLLHMDLMAGWSAKRLAPWCLGVFVLLVVSYRAIVYFPAWSTYHIFDMDLRVHITGQESPNAPGGGMP